jgi:hypothetical protein
LRQRFSRIRSNEADQTMAESPDPDKFWRWSPVPILTGVGIVVGTCCTSLQVVQMVAPDVLPIWRRAPVPQVGAKQSAQQEAAKAPAPSPAPPKRAEAPPPPKKKQPPAEQITTGSVSECIPINRIANDLQNRDSWDAEDLQSFYAPKDLCIREPLPVATLSTTRATFAYEQREYLFERRRLTIILLLAPGQDLTAIAPDVSVQIAGKPIAYERKIFVPDVLVFKDGRIKLPADPSRITSTR